MLPVRRVRPREGKRVASGNKTISGRPRTALLVQLAEEFGQNGFPPVTARQGITCVGLLTEPSLPAPPSLRVQRRFRGAALTREPPREDRRTFSSLTSRLSSALETAAPRATSRPWLEPRA